MALVTGPFLGRIASKKVIKMELSQRGSQYSPLVEADIQLLGARVSTKGSNVETVVNPSGEEHVGHMLPIMGLYVQRENYTHLMALGKVYEERVYHTWCGLCR